MKKTSSSPMAQYNSDTRLTRQRQITTLKVYNENVEEVVENSEYKVSCSVNSVPVSLMVKLPPEFPESPPVIICSPPLIHQWLETDGRVTGKPVLIIVDVDGHWKVLACARLG